MVKVTLFHYTNKQGWNAIRTQLIWRFKASKPQHQDRPEGVYFTDLGPSRINVRLLHKRVRVPRSKQEYVFGFAGNDRLTQLNGGRGRDRRIYYSPIDYDVDEDRQLFVGQTQQIMEQQS